MKISSKANFHLRPASPADHENFTSKKLFVTAFEWMKKKICKLVRCVQKVLKPRQTRVKISRSQIERARTSENGTRKKLTDCASSKEASNNERQACCSDFHKLERITRNVRSLKRYPNETISSFNISCTPANYFETFQQQRADLHQVLIPHPKNSVWSSGALTDSKDTASRLIPASGVCCPSCWSANSLLASGGASIACSLLRVICPLPALCKNHSAFGVPEKKRIVFK